MIKITFPDLAVKEYPAGITGFEVAKSISNSLAANAVAIKINNNLHDLSFCIHENARLEIITSASVEGMEIIQHDGAHLLAYAVKELYPEVQVTIGPAINEGFYYDFYCKTAFNIEDLPIIEAKMHEIIKRNERTKRVVMSRNEAIDYFTNRGELYKVEIIKDLPTTEEITIYFHGDFADLCRGPHAPSFAFIKAFKLTKISGAYWRGNSQNQALQRVYGTAWPTKDQLSQYLHRIEEAEKRDHRKIGKEMDLFHFQEEAPGAVFWHPNGWKIFQLLISYMRNKCYNYQEVNSPEIMDSSVWVTSGHAEKFGHHMFCVTAHDDSREYALKPMSCPGSVQIFKARCISYRDLPLRLAEYGKVHRYESSGSLHGLLRVRAFTQDDAHIFCTEEQIQVECLQMIELALSIYKDFGFENVKVKLSTRPEKRIGDEAIWDKSELALGNAIQQAGLELIIMEGEGAFYGPKIEFAIKDALNREWQIGTIQIDFNLPIRFEATYTGQDGSKHTPVMIHRAFFGSMERFIGILIEQTKGHLPFWLCPVQITIININDEVMDYATYIYNKLQQAAIRALLDCSAQTMNYKIRAHSLRKTPIIVVIGHQEKQNNTVSIRKIGNDKSEVFEFTEFLDTIVSMARVPF